MTSQQITIDNITYHTTLHLPTSHHSLETAPVVVLVHALMANSQMYDSVLPALQSSYRVLTYDHIGHGQSPPPPSELLTGPLFSFDSMTKHLRTLVQRTTGSARVFAIVGCSMGGVLALRYAMLYPRDVERVIAIGAPGLRALDEAKPLWTQRIEVFEKDLREGTSLLAERTSERWVPGDEERSVRAREKALYMCKACTIDGYKVCADAIRDYDYLDDLAGIQARCLIMVGDRDTAVGPREVLLDVKKRIPGADYCLLQGAGHLPPLHSPDEFNQILLKFLGNHWWGRG